MSAIETVRRFARATNLTVAGRRFAVAGDGSDAEALRLILRGLGGREARAGERVDHLWCTASGHSTRTIREAAAGQPGAPLIAVDAGAGAPALDLSHLGRAHAVRPGVLALDEMSDVFVVPFGDSAVPTASEASAGDSSDAAVAATGSGSGPASGSTDIALSDARARIAWARRFMPVTASLAEFGDGPGLYGLRIALSMVLEPKTAVLALLLAEAGADVAVFAFAAETDDATAGELAARGIAVHASHAATPEEERANALALLDRRPQLLVDDGAHVIRLAHAERPDVVAGLIGATEETTSGVTPLRAMAADGALRVPVVAANDAVTKTWFDNRHGTGETCVLAIVRTLDDDLFDVPVVVVGFGPVGEGVAERLRVLGARVVVVEADPRRELAARFAGYATAPVLDAVRHAELVVSATGAPRTIDEAVLAACREDTAIAVAGGAPEEVLIPAGTRAERIAPHVERLHLPGGGTVRLLAGGDCVNIVAGEGNPIDVMDLSFGVQATAVGMLLDGGLAPGVHVLPEATDRGIAGLALGRDAAALTSAAAVDWRRTRFDL